MTDVTIRRAKPDDLDVIVELLDYLSPTTDTTEKQAATFWRILEHTDAITVVAECKKGDHTSVIGVGTLYLIDKVLRGGSTVGQIEDVVVHPYWRGNNIGKRIIEDLVDKAKFFECYKVVLNCSEENVAFYEKCGFHKHEHQMRKDLHDFS